MSFIYDSAGRMSPTGINYLKVTPNGVVMTTGHIAKLIGVTSRTVSKWADSGKLKHYRIPGSLDRRFYAHDVLAFMQGQGWEPPEGLVSMLHGGRDIVMYGLDPLVVNRVADLIPKFKGATAAAPADIWELAPVLANRAKSGTLVVGPLVPVGEARAVFQKANAEFWAFCHVYADDQTPAPEAVHALPADRPDKLLEYLTFNLTHPVSMKD